MLGQSASGRYRAYAAPENGRPEAAADRGVIEITITDEQVALRMPQAPQLGVYRVERKRTLH